MKSARRASARPAAQAPVTLFSRCTSAALAIAIHVSALLGCSTLITGRGRSPLGSVWQAASMARADRAKLIRAFAKLSMPPVFGFGLKGYNGRDAQLFQLRSGSGRSLTCG